MLSEQYLKLLQDSNGNGNGNANGENDDEVVSIARKALDLAEEQCSDLFVDQFGTPYAAVKIGEHIETLSLKDSTLDDIKIKNRRHILPNQRNTLKTSTIDS